MAETLAVSLLAAIMMAVDASQEVNMTTQFPTLLAPTTSSPMTSSLPCPSPTTCQSCPLVVSCTPELPPRMISPIIEVKEESRPCSGVVHLKFGRLHSLPLCNDSMMELSKDDVCKGWRCGRFQRLGEAPPRNLGYQLRNGTVVNTTCYVMEIQCEVSSVEKQLAAYRAATALLCTILLLLLLALFGPAAYRAMLKKQSEKRKDRWIGPMQSQSVSFHRAQTGIHPSSGTYQRHSSLGLDRLTVNSSMESSSNRNSTCDSYN